MAKLPTFESEAEMIAWFDSHDTADYMDEMELTNERFEVVLTKFATQPLTLRMRTTYIEAIEKVAAQKGIPSQTLIQNWLLERLQMESANLAR